MSFAAGARVVIRFNTIKSVAVTASQKDGKPVVLVLVWLHDQDVPEGVDITQDDRTAWPEALD